MELLGVGDPVDGRRKEELSKPPLDGGEWSPISSPLRLDEQFIDLPGEVEDCSLGEYSSWIQEFLADAPSLDEVEIHRLVSVLRRMTV
ncbi:hypothetical protein ABZ832_12325 [Streptantibioticus parmotrematis]|uniref:hypothetical protein n=1 Tax=Streptantibioticus parmotrematis TaxID=2873249 RepID=UPI0033EC9DC8